MLMITTDARTLSYDVSGAGAPIVFVAGLGERGTYWKAQVAAFSSAFQVVTFDHRGVGASVGCGHTDDWRLIVPLLVLLLVLFFLVIIAVRVSRRHRVTNEAGKPPVGQDKNVLRHALSPLAPVGCGDPHRRMLAHLASWSHCWCYPPGATHEFAVPPIAAGNKPAMQALFARHRTSVYRWLLRFVSNETLAEDLLSEVFLDVWRQAARFEYRSSVSTWLLSIARHKALSARRRRTEAELDEKIEATVADPADDPEVALQEKNRAELLRRALTRLSPEHRQVIDLVYYHEKSVDEVAQIIDVLPATVKTRMFYARKKLAELVKRAETGRA
jgi:RNA polymerase sigma-70 factor, ECF subfamily